MTGTVPKPETSVKCTCASGVCPLHADNPAFNAVTLAAMQEAKDIADGKIPGKWCNSIEDARKELGI